MVGKGLCSASFWFDECVEILVRENLIQTLLTTYSKKLNIKHIVKRLRMIVIPNALVRLLCVSTFDLIGFDY